MIRRMLDTNICNDLLRTRTRGVPSRLRRFKIDEVAISTITFAELQHGAAKSARPAHHAMLIAEFCAPLAIASFDHRAAETYGAVRAALERAGTPIGPLDTLIASHALSLGASLVTNNQREFARVDGLLVEPWGR